jgi:hypothetical protein
MIERNALITSASLDIERGMCLSGWLYLDYGKGNGSQNFGGQVLYLDKTCTHHTLESYAGHWIYRVMEIAGVEKWKDLPGKSIRVRLDKDGLGGIIQGVGHITNDDWFMPKEDFK